MMPFDFKKRQSTMWRVTLRAISARPYRIERGRVDHRARRGRSRRRKHVDVAVLVREEHVLAIVGERPGAQLLGLFHALHALVRGGAAHGNARSVHRRAAPCAPRSAPRRSASRSAHRSAALSAPHPRYLVVAHVWWRKLQLKASFEIGSSIV
jgi:hypothetical protein